MLDNKNKGLQNECFGVTKKYITPDLLPIFQNNLDFVVVYCSWLIPPYLHVQDRQLYNKPCILPVNIILFLTFSALIPNVLVNFLHFHQLYIIKWLKDYSTSALKVYFIDQHDNLLFIPKRVTNVN